MVAPAREVWGKGRRTGKPLEIAAAVVAALTALLALVGCEAKNPDCVRCSLYRSTVELKRDSAATVAFFETVLADSVQRERLARVILANEGMRRTLVHGVLADSLALEADPARRTSTPPRGNPILLDRTGEHPAQPSPR